MQKIFIILLLLASMGLIAQEVVPVDDSLLYTDELYQGDSISVGDTLNRRDFLQTGPILDMLDSLYRSSLFGGNGGEVIYHKNKYGYAPDFVPVYSDSVHFERMAHLNRHTPIELTYNWQVKEFIDLYGVRRRNLTSRVLGLSDLYFPLFEEHLDRLGLPLELKYLAIVESALIPTARSRAGATGLWQFMYGTGKMYNLQVTSLVDDRCDPYKSTVAAAEHLRDLYNIYNDWLLALAAYNSGPGNVNRAIRRSGGKTSFWEISPFLPRETRGYVPAFIAVTYIMSHPEEHNLYPVKPEFLYYEIDTVAIKDVLSFDQLADILKIPVDQLKFLNPSFRQGIIPASAEKKYFLRLPQQYIGDFIEKEKDLYSYTAERSQQREQLLAQVKQMKEQQYHRVRKGETLGSIARIYHCSVNDLKRWNNLKSTSLAIGQRLMVQAGPGYKPPVATKANISSKPSPTGVHVVKSGETLGEIAALYKISVAELKKLNNLNTDFLQVNQKLKVTGEAAPAAQVATTIQAGKQKFIFYTVQKGDTLWEIANKHKGVTVEQIRKWNNFGIKSTLQPGQKIIVGVSG